LYFKETLFCYEKYVETCPSTYLFPCDLASIARALPSKLIIMVDL
jgi:hypothetical protein